MKAILMLFAVAGIAHAAGPVFTAILGGSYQSYVSSVESDAQSNTYIAGMTSARAFPVTPGAYQTTFSGTYDAFVAKLGPDGKAIWATYLGGSFENYAAGLALDSAGNVWVTGTTNSWDFPLVNPVQSYPNGVGYAYYAFVAKFSPDGAKLLYSTYLGGAAAFAGNGAESAGIAVDSANNAYVAVNVNSATGFPGIQNGPNQAGIMVTELAPQGTVVYSYFHPGGYAAAITLDSPDNIYVAGCSGNPNSVFSTPQPQQAIVFKIASDGSKKLWETALGSSAQSAASAIAVNGAGEVWVGGRTSSANFPLVNPLQNTLAERPLWKSADGGMTWTPLDNLPFALPQVMVVDPATPTTLYEATADLGVFKSVDGGATWTAASNGIAAPNVWALATDPVHPQTLYAVTATTVYKSLDGTKTWTAIDSPPAAITQIEVDAQNPDIVYEVGNSIRKSTDGGATWNSVAFGNTVVSMVLDPRLSGHIFASVSDIPGCTLFPGCNVAGIYRSVDGGATWTQNSSVYPTTLPLLADPSTNPSTIYDGLNDESVDGGVTWTPIAPLPSATQPGASVLAMDPGGVLYAAVYASTGGLFVSRDHAQTWAPISSPGPEVGSLAAAGSGGALYAVLGPANFTAGTQSAGGTAGFLSKIGADGSTLEYSTYLRGHQSTLISATAYMEPGFFLTQNWISGIALDPAGNVIVTGGTRAADFATVNPLQAANAGLADAFAAVISADGSRLNYSTYLGGSQDDGGLAVALDNQGNVILAGQTWSLDFPVPSGVPEPAGGGDAFVVKLAIPVTPAISSVLNAASFQPGIEAGSWAMITGSKLSNTTRTWRSSDFVGANLPTSLDGVSVTIDGIPAFVEYISPTQINVLAPSDSATGTVNVVVDNNGAISAPSLAQLQAVAPAFFMSGTSAIASVLPGYTPVSATAPAHPGDLVVLWGTGLGPTSPPTPAGSIVTGAPPTATLPVVTIGGMPVPVISSVLTTGTAGLYQITVQLPANVPTGALAIQASVGGVQTQSGITLLVGTP